MNRKIVGVTGANPVLNNDDKAPFLATRMAYLNVLQDYGITPVMINNTTDKAVLDHYAEFLDGLLLTGGGDVHPKYYNCEREPETGAYNQVVSELRDQTELYLVEKFYEKKKPMLGICRGSQILNVFFGGTLIQDVKTKFHNLSERHMTPQEEGLWYVKAHPVKIEPNSKFAQIIGKTEIEVNSAHHQMVDTTGEKIKVVAKSPEGVHEAIEYTGNDCFIMGVQWHPEQLSTEESSKNIFKAFADAIHLFIRPEAGRW